MRFPPKKRKPQNESSEKTIPYNKCIAKTHRTTNGNINAGKSVFEHCQIVAKISKELVSRLPENVTKKLLPKGYELIVGAHDIGKISPTFQQKILRNITDYDQNTYSFLKDINPKHESNWGGHAGTSQICLEELNIGKFIPEIVGQHHGYKPNIGLYTAKAKMLGGEAWQKERTLLLEKLKKELNLDWPQIISHEQARFLTGLTIVSDWIGSGEYFENPDESWQQNINTAPTKAGFIPPVLKKKMSFKEIFGFRPYKVQEDLFSIVNNPGVYILEAPMGIGKTEAALYSAYLQICNGRAGGIYFALPTQLTSNKIYDRFNQFLNTILSDDCPFRSALLLHSSAWLLEGSDMGKECRPGSSWFNHRKRGLLAPFAVGTIDQALMATMNVKHGSVRAFGLAGKVIILDEVHTYDIYTGTILNSLIKLLQKLNCTIIILSATLSLKRKKKLFNADLKSIDYPLITTKCIDLELVEKPVSINLSPVAVKLEFRNNPAETIDTILKKASEGQQVLWIENSVPESQECYQLVAARAIDMKIECGLLHSRFTKEHRRNKEEHWVNQFGKKGWTTRRKKGRILIGTQVLEQSLDIDADFLVSRFCPTDMLLQRCGRLWRHNETPRPVSAERKVLLISPEPSNFQKNPEHAFGTSGFVYNPYVLHRSYEVWKDKKEISLPDDIRIVIESTYRNRDETGFMTKLFNELENGNRYRKGRIALEQLADITLSKNGTTLSETKTETRYSEVDTLELLLVQDIILDSQSKTTIIKLLNENTVLFPWNKYKRSRNEWKKISMTLMDQTVKISFKTAPLPVSKDFLDKIGLGNCLYLGDKKHEDSWLRIATVDKTGILKGFQGAPLNNDYDLKYREDIGYISFKQKE